MEANDVYYRTHSVTEHLMHSTGVAQTFRIKVLQPMSRSDGSERFPVLYVTDSDHFFGGLSDLASLLQILGDTPRFILVGIGYEPAAASRLLRWRDLVPHAARRQFEPMIAQLANSALVGGVKDVNAITHTTDASDFLSFIREELVPFINEQYPALPDNDNYYGYSAGGGFGLYTLFTQPETFRRYILGSPATSYYGNHFGLEWVKDFLKAGRALDAQVFMSVGELEEFERGQEQCDLVTGYYLLTKFLRSAAIPGLVLTSRIFSGESHATAWTLAFSHGLKTLFGPVDRVPYVPDWK